MVPMLSEASSILLRVARGVFAGAWRAHVEGELAARWSFLKSTPLFQDWDDAALLEVAKAMRPRCGSAPLTRSQISCHS